VTCYRLLYVLAWCLLSGGALTGGFCCCVSCATVVPPQELFHVGRGDLSSFVVASSSIEWLLASGASRSVLPSTASRACQVPRRTFSRCNAEDLVGEKDHALLSLVLAATVLHGSRPVQLNQTSIDSSITGHWPACVTLDLNSAPSGPLLPGQSLKVSVPVFAHATWYEVFSVQLVVVLSSNSRYVVVCMSGSQRRRGGVRALWRSSSARLHHLFSNSPGPSPANVSLIAPDGGAQAHGPRCVASSCALGGGRHGCRCRPCRQRMHVGGSAAQHVGCGHVSGSHPARGPSGYRWPCRPRQSGHTHLCSVGHRSPTTVRTAVV
jgi:hypothetical protein